VSDRAARYKEKRLAFWNQHIQRRASNYYHNRIIQIYRHLIPPGCRVLELGCGRGDLLAALKPALAVGIDFSPEMIRSAARRHCELRLIQADVHEVEYSEKFDYIILSDLVNDLWDVQAVLDRLGPACSAGTRIIINSYSRLWELPLALVRLLHLANPLIGQNWLTPEDLENMLSLSRFEVIRRWQEVLLPLWLPPLDNIFNRYLVRLPVFRHAALTNFIIARPLVLDKTQTDDKGPIVSVIVPARNEAGNIEELFRRVPEMGGGTELIFVEGHSSDDTYAAIERSAAKYPERRCRLLRQSGSGKGDAVRMGFAHAGGDVLMILDADLTVSPEDLPRFYRALRAGKGELINGVRLVYPMEERAMRFLNVLGNKLFSLTFSWLLGQKIKDTLCGTKALKREHYELIACNRSYFGDFDPFGDFDLIFGAAKLNLKIVDVPIRYGERKYGRTNIARWRHGWLLLRMVLFASRRITFI